ncbi:MAG: DUF4892 domain-containing protein [Pseudomonadota bacterium]
MFFAVSALPQDPSGPEAYILDLQEYDYLQPLGALREGPVRNYLVPLGAVQKVRGVWAPRESERVSGERLAQTWQLDAGFTAAEVVDELEAQLGTDPSAELLFACGGVSCGSSVQWANRIFRERLLYGTQASQLYRAYALERDESAYRVLIYGSARSADRQFVHVEFLSLAPSS